MTPPSPDEVRAFRASVGLSQTGFGEALGASMRTVQEWESGRNTAPPMLRLAMAAINANLKPWVTQP